VTEEAKLVPLRRPRPLASDERLLVEALVEPLGSQELHMQVEHAEVVALCSCGCPSIGLHTNGPELPPGVLKQLSDTDRTDVLNLSAWGVNRGGREVEVTLHLVHGRLHELEVWAGTYRGDPVTDLPKPQTIRR
jgi:hypothetical protein